MVQLSSDINAHDFYGKYTRARQLELEYDAVSEQMEGASGETASELEARADELETQIMAIANTLRGNLTPQNDVRVSVEKLYMVVPEKDMEDWLRVLVRCRYKPAGIVAYNGDTVRLEDFASNHKGDGGELAGQLRSIVAETPETRTYVDMLGDTFSDEMRYGEVNHMIAPEYLTNTRTMTVANGRLVVG